MVLGLVFVVVLAASVLVWLVMWLLREEADEPPQVRVNRLNSLDEPTVRLWDPEATEVLDPILVRPYARRQKQQEE